MQNVRTTASIVPTTTAGDTVIIHAYRENEKQLVSLAGYKLYTETTCVGVSGTKQKQQQKKTIVKNVVSPTDVYRNRSSLASGIRKYFLRHTHAFMFFFFTFKTRPGQREDR